MNYWFPARRYGWGWGLPTAWQGWVVLAVFVALLAVGFVLVPPTADAIAFIDYVLVLVGVLVGICWVTGEPTQWRWGK